MPNHPAYHGVITQEEAKSILQQNRGSSLRSSYFLLRFSRENEVYILTSLGLDNEIYEKQLVIDQEEKIYYLRGSDKQFTSMEKLIKYFRSNPVNERMRLIGKPCNKSSPCILL